MELARRMQLALMLALALALGLPACGGGGGDGPGGDSFVADLPRDGGALPPGGGGGANPPPPDGDQPPDDLPTPPDDGGEVIPPDDGGEVIPPDDSGEVIPPPGQAPFDLPSLPAYSPFTHVNALAIDPASGDVYGVDAGSSDLLVFLAAQGIVENLGPTGLADVKALAYREATGSLLASVGASGDSWLVEVVGGPIQVTDIGLIAGHPDVTALVWSTADDLLVAIDMDTRELLQIDPDTAAAVTIAPLGEDIERVMDLAMDGNRLYAVDVLRAQFLELDTATGAIVRQAELPRPVVTGLAFDRASRMFFASDPDRAELFVYDPFGSQINMAAVLGLAHDDAARTIYGSHAGFDMLVAVDLKSGWRRWIGPIGHANVEALAYDQERDVLFGVSNATDQLLTLDRNSGKGLAVGLLTGAPWGVWSDVASLAWDKMTGALYGVDAASRYLLQIDKDTGAAVPVLLLAASDVRSLAHEPGTRTLHAVDNLFLKHVAIDIGALEEVKIGDVPAAIGGKAFDGAKGRLYGTDFLRPDLVVVYESAGVADTYGTVSALAYHHGAGMFYAVNRDENLLLAIEQASTQIRSEFTLPADMAVEGMVLDEHTGLLYAFATSHAELWEIDPFSGDAVLKRPFGTDGIHALALDLPGRMLYGVDAQNDELVILDLQTDNETVVTGAAGAFANIEAAAYDHTRNAIVAIDRVDRRLLRIDPATGDVTEFRPVPFDDIRGLAHDVATDLLYAIDVATDRLISLNGETGEASP